MRLLFVADGPRDQAVIPQLVGRIFGAPIADEFREWKRLRLRRGSGYRRRLQFAVRQARDQGLDGVVATIDRDTARQGDRLSALRSARDEDRKDSKFTPLPTALGEANPHMEAWLLDDLKAIRDILRFDGDKSIPNVRNTDPKDSLNDLIDESERTDDLLEILGEIAANVDADRCNHSSKTGFDEFVQDVNDELASLKDTAS